MTINIGKLDIPIREWLQSDGCQKASILCFLPEFPQGSLAQDVAALTDDCDILRFQIWQAIFYLSVPLCFSQACIMRCRKRDKLKMDIFHFQAKIQYNCKEAREFLGWNV